MALTFYRGLASQIRVLSFDLDDTLYQNHEVIRQAEQAQLDAVAQITSAEHRLTQAQWRELKWQVAKQQPELCHDVSRWRYQVIKLGLAQLGCTEQADIDYVYQAFYQARSNFTVPAQSFDVLAQLQQQYQLIAVTNGNADIEKLGLSQYFSGYYRAGEQGCRMKPHPDMLQKAMQDFNLSPAQLLHIGDSVSSDIQAAHNANVASLWFNPAIKPLPSGCALPTAEYSQLTDLLALLA